MTPPKMPPYGIRSVGRRIEVASETPLAFEPKGWQRAMRSALRTTISKLAVGPDEIVSGVYSGQSSPWRADAENVLFYNVGCGAFAESASNGLRFERVFGDASSIGADRRFAHAATYEPTAVAAPLRYSTRGKTLATLRGAPLAASEGTPSASEVWASVRDAAQNPDAIQFERPGLCGGYFGLSLTVQVPADRAAPRAVVNAAALLKPIVDGVVAAFTAHDGGDLDGVSARLAERLRRRPADVAKMLMQSPTVLLSTQRLVVCRSRGVQWLPPDDRCVACELLVVRDTGGSGWRLSGTLYVANPSGRADNAADRCAL